MAIVSTRWPLAAAGLASSLALAACGTPVSANPGDLAATAYRDKTGVPLPGCQKFSGTPILACSEEAMKTALQYR